MPIIATSYFEIDPRTEAHFTIASMIDEAASSGDDIDSYTLAGEILEAIEASVNSVDDDGTVIYRA